MSFDALGRLGRLVRRTRTAAGLTQGQLGHPLLSKSFISQLEQGSVWPSLTSLFHIADMIGMRPGQLLGVADETQWATTVLDMAEATLVLNGIQAGDEWVRRLEASVPIAKLADRGLDRRWRRYVGIQRLIHRQSAAAITLLESAMTDMSTDGGPRDLLCPGPDDHVTQFWLGVAHKQAAHRLQALHAWERLITYDIAPLLATVTWLHLGELYEAIGDEYESRRARDSLERAVHARACLHNGQPLARLLWQCADSEFANGDLGGASAHARLIPLLLSTEVFPAASLERREDLMFQRQLHT